MLEHHSNIVPWQMLAQEKGATIRVVPINDAGELLLDEYRGAVQRAHPARRRGHVSNALGTINPVKEMIAFAHARGVPVLVDGAQAAPHLAVDVQDLDCDFYAFSGHKLCGPTGIGILYGKAALLEAMQPFKGGGDMILSVTFEKTTYNPIPHKFEAGTPPIAAAIGLGAAVDYLGGIGMAAIAAHEHDLLRVRHRATGGACPACACIGTAQHKAAVLSFALRRRASARRRHAAESGGRGGAHRPPLRPAADAAVRRAGHLARLVCVLQHTGRCRRAGGRHSHGSEGIRMSADPKALYQEVILDHNRKPRNYGELAHASHHAEGVNPLCGDHIQLALDIRATPSTRIAFHGESCAICKASASMMTAAVKGKTRAMRPRR